MSFDYNEDNLVEQATIDILTSIGWEVETAWHNENFGVCLLYTSDAADDSLRVDLGGRRIIKKTRRRRCVLRE